MCASLNINTRVNEEVLFEKTYQRLLPELLAIHPKDLIAVNLEIDEALTTVFGAVEELRRHRSALETALPHFDLEQFDRIEDYAMALSYASARCAAATQPPDTLRALHAEALKLRYLLSLDISKWIARGFIHTSSVKALKGPNEFKNVAIDLHFLACIAKEYLPAIEGKCAIQTSDIERAFKLASLMLRGIGPREQTPARQAEAADMRTRVFTLLTRAYDEARRALTYLRWHDGDVDTIIPSLDEGHSNARHKTSAEAAEPQAPVTIRNTGIPDAVVTPPLEAPPPNGAGGKAVTTPTNFGPFMQ